jgi:hypothetical protein
MDAERRRSAAALLQDDRGITDRYESGHQHKPTKRRRDVVKLLAGAAIAAPYRVAAQTSAKTYRLAMLAGDAAMTADSPMGKILTGALAEHGYTLGQSLEIQAYGANVHDTEH